jgi:hypothetical protein
LWHYPTKLKTTMILRLWGVIYDSIEAQWVVPVLITYWMICVTCSTYLVQKVKQHTSYILRWEASRSSNSKFSIFCLSESICFWNLECSRSTVAAVSLTYKLTLAYENNNNNMTLDLTSRHC